MGKRKTDLVQWNVRVPRWVRESVRKLAKEEGISSQQYIVRLLTLASAMQEESGAIESAVTGLFGNQVVNRIEEIAERAFQEIQRKQALMQRAVAIGSSGVAVPAGPPKKRRKRKVSKKNG